MNTQLEWLIKAGDALPKKGKAYFKAAETLKSGSKNSLNFKLFEGEITDPVTDNRDIGTLKIRGSDFDGVITAGSELICEYEMLDSGNIILHVLIPSIGASVDSERNFYSPQDGQIDYSTAKDKIIFDADKLTDRVEDIVDKGISDNSLVDIRRKITKIKELTEDSDDIEKNQEAQERLLEAKKLLAKFRKKHLKEVRMLDFTLVTDFFEEHVRKYSKKSEAETFEALKRSAKKDLERNSKDFESSLDEIRYLNYNVLNRQDWFVIDRFKYAVKSPFNYSDESTYKQLIARGERMINSNDLIGLRRVMAELAQIKINDDFELSFLEEVNIVKG